MLNDKSINEHKAKLIGAKDNEGQPEAVQAEVMLSLRVNAL